MKTALLFLVMFGSLPLAAAQRDFLTSSEASQVQEVQEPNERIRLYLKFARQRLSQVEQILSREKAGRGGMIHDALDDYSRIIDALDDVTDDALRRSVDVKSGMEDIASAEKEMLATLHKIRAKQPKDLTFYDFVLKTAIDTTSDSLDSANEGAGSRKAEVAAQQAREKKELESMMSPQEREAKKAAEKKEAKQKRKIPTLRRPGEKLPGEP